MVQTAFKKKKLFKLNFLNMKRILLTMFIAGSLIIVGAAGCKKQDFRPVLSGGGVSTQTAEPVILHLVADQWVINGGEVYVNTFHNVLTYAQVSAHTQVQVYLETSDGETLLSDTPVIFKGHELWTRTIATDVSLVYKCVDEHMPFNSMNIKIVI
jgi:hypothetical protein